jgi:DnaJ-class molecular chaperone
MAQLHQHMNSTMSNEQNDKQSTERSGAIDKPAVSERSPFPCPFCGGDGWAPVTDRWGNILTYQQCFTCHGDGRLWNVR